MTIYKTKRLSKPWAYRWREGGKHHSRSFKTKAEAVAFQGEIVARKFTGTLRPADRGSQKFETFALQWLENSTRRRASTTFRHKQILEMHVIPLIGAVPLNRISRENLQKLVKTWDQRGLKPRTIVRHLAVIKAIFNEAILSDLIDKNPAIKLDIPEVQNPERRALEMEEVEELLNTIDQFWRPHLYIAIATGMRWSELQGATMRSFDRRKQEIKVLQSKTKAGIRTIKLTDTSMKMLTKHLSQTGRNSSIMDGPLFTTPEGTILNYSNFRNRVFKPAVARIGLPNLRIHDLRRTTATLLIEGGCSVKELQTLLGHSESRTTLDLYSQSTERGKRTIASQMEDILSKEKVRKVADSNKLENGGQSESA